MRRAVAVSHLRQYVQGAHDDIPVRKRVFPSIHNLSSTRSRCGAHQEHDEGGLAISILGGCPEHLSLPGEDRTFSVE